jgi:hypothetical protein
MSSLGFNPLGTNWRPGSSITVRACRLSPTPRDQPGTARTFDEARAKALIADRNDQDLDQMVLEHLTGE